MQIEFREIATLKPYAKNARTHSAKQINLIAASIKEFGFTNPILIASDGELIAGHGRLEAALLLGMARVPTIVLGALTADQRRALVLADNRIAAEAGWNREMLSLELGDLKASGFDLGLTGFRDSELRALIGTTNAERENETPAIPALPTAQTGDVWLLGAHRVCCGDCTDPSMVEQVLAGAAPLLMVTDPPYGVELDMEWRDSAGLSRLARAEPSYLKKRIECYRNTTISYDTRADWASAFALVPSLDTAYVWHADRFTIEVGLGLRGIGFDLKQLLVWIKSHFVFSRMNYHSQHEPCWYARKKGARAFAGPQNQSTLWESASPKMLMGGSTEEKFDHPTQKPVSLYVRPIENHIAPGECFYEPFSGSGTAIIAAEMTGRTCCAIEVNPLYVDVAVERWQKYTGRKAVRESDGVEFDDARKKAEADRSEADSGQSRQAPA